MAKRRAALSVGSSAALSFSGGRGLPHARAKYFRGVALASVLSTALLSLRCGSRTFDLLPDEAQAGGGQRSGSGAGARAGSANPAGGTGGKLGQGGRNNPPGGFVGFGGSGGRGEPPVNPICEVHLCAQSDSNCAPCSERCDECVCGWCIDCPPCTDGLVCDPLTSNRCAWSCDGNEDCREARSEANEALPLCRPGFRPAVCVQCINSRDCNDPDEPYCAFGRCIECVDDDDCTELGQPYCNARGRCVECTNGDRHCAGDVCDDGVCRR